MGNHNNKLVAGGAVAGGAAGYGLGHLMTSKSRAKKEALKGKIAEASKKRNSLKNEKTSLKLKGGLSTQDIAKIKKLKRDVSNYKNKALYTADEVKRVRELNQEIRSIEEGAKVLTNTGNDYKKDLDRGNVTRSRDVISGMMTKRQKSELAKLKHEAQVRGNQRSEEYAKELDQLKSKFKLSGADAERYMKIKEKLKKGNLPKKESDALRKRMNIIKGLSTAGGAVLSGVVTHAMLNKNRKYRY